ncbi:MAG: flagellar type III secretion system pore protein FliP [Rhizobiales bacterium]|nr:flagellar type III secretion system pore protein FliP [Hyphomicrobiales bacterium]
MIARIAFIAAAIFSVCGIAVAQVPDQGTFPGIPGDLVGGDASARIVQYFVLVSALSVIPGVLIVATSFTRIIVALSFLRSSIGLQTTPANIVMILLALFLTFFIMAPTVEKAYTDGYIPYTERKIGERQAFDKITAPFREFMLKNVREKEMAFFSEQASASGLGENLSQSDFRILLPAFMISELRRGFEIGFLIALPFLVIDIVVATVVMSMGMMMLPPTVISLPFKILFFILVDGWTLLAGSLIKSFS